MQYIKEKVAKINKQIGNNTRKTETIKREKSAVEILDVYNTLSEFTKKFLPQLNARFGIVGKKGSVNCKIDQYKYKLPDPENRKKYLQKKNSSLLTIRTH